MKFYLITSENLIYNDFIDKEFIKLSEINDSSFYYEINQDTKYGIYIIKFSSHLVQNTKIYLKIKKLNSDEYEKPNEININVKVGIPNQNYNKNFTEIT